MKLSRTYKNVIPYCSQIYKKRMYPNCQGCQNYSLYYNMEYLNFINNSNFVYKCHIFLMKSSKILYNIVNIYYHVLLITIWTWEYNQTLDSVKVIHHTIEFEIINWNY